MGDPENENGGSDSDYGRTHVFTRKVIQRLRGEDRRGISAANISMAVGIVVSLVGLGGVIMDAGAQKEKIRSLEENRAETKALVEQRAAKLEKQISDTDDKVDIIIRQLSEIQGEMRAERRRERNGKDSGDK